MRSEAEMKKALQQYLDGFNQKDAERIISLFADDARIEDPVGGGWIVEGKEAITEFYRQGVEVVEKLELDTPIRGSLGRVAEIGHDRRAMTICFPDYLSAFGLASTSGPLSPACGATWASTASRPRSHGSAASTRSCITRSTRTSLADVGTQGAQCTLGAFKFNRGG